jgi:curved DNA-binding protein CbpA
LSEDRLDELDYYDLLQVAEDATVDDVRRAFHAFALRYHPDRFAGAPPEKRDRAAHIYRRGAEGYRVLCDRELRRTYDEQRARGKRRFDPEDNVKPKLVPTEGIGSQAMSVKSPRARPFVQKATEAYRKGDWATAKLNLKLALQHEPGNPILVARLVEVEQKLGTKK